MSKDLLEADRQAFALKAEIEVSKYRAAGEMAAEALESVDSFIGAGALDYSGYPRLPPVAGTALQWCK